MSGFLETSVIVRYMTRDDAELAQAAVGLIDSDIELYVSAAIVAEVAHVLRRVYAVPRPVIVDRLVDFLRKQNISTSGVRKDLAIDGLLMCRPSGRVSFADAMIWAEARSAGHEVIYTFDQRFPGIGVTIRHSAP